MPQVDESWEIRSHKPPVVPVASCCNHSRLSSWPAAHSWLFQATTTAEMILKSDPPSLASSEKNEASLMKNIQTFYPLSPVQEGMLFHTLYVPGSEVCIEQSHWTWLADLDTKAFERAWQRVIDRHAILRSSFIWEGVNEPIQVVHRQVGLSFIKEDW